VLMADGDADEVLLIVAEQVAGDPQLDCAHALLLGWPAEPLATSRFALAGKEMS